MSQRPTRCNSWPTLHSRITEARTCCAGGISPDEVAAILIDAIVAGEFYVPTKPSFTHQMQARYEDLIARKLPRSPEIDWSARRARSLDAAPHEVFEEQTRGQIGRFSLYLLPSW